MALVFRPPATREIPRTLPGRKRDRIWNHFRAPSVGPAVLKQSDGSYVELEEPTTQQIKAAAVVYFGGYRNVVTEQEAADLRTAGYTITEE